MVGEGDSDLPLQHTLSISFAHHNPVSELQKPTAGFLGCIHHLEIPLSGIKWELEEGK